MSHLVQVAVPLLSFRMAGEGMSALQRGLCFPDFSSQGEPLRSA